MTAKDPYKVEWQYVYLERLGMMCDDREPTPEQDQAAARVATDAVEAMKLQDRKLKQADLI